MLKKGIQVAIALNFALSVAACSGGTHSSDLPAVANEMAQRSMQTSAVQELRRLGAAQKAQSRLPNIGETVPRGYGVPLSRQTVSALAASHPNLGRELGDNATTFSLITVPPKPAPNAGIAPMSAVEGVCGYIVTETEYYWNRYANGVLVDSTYLGTQVTDVTPIYCDEGGDGNTIVNVVDCQATPDDPACANMVAVACASQSTTTSSASLNVTAKSGADQAGNLLGPLIQLSNPNPGGGSPGEAGYDPGTTFSFTIFVTFYDASGQNISENTIDGSTTSPGAAFSFQSIDAAPGNGPYASTKIEVTVTAQPNPGYSATGSTRCN